MATDARGHTVPASTDHPSRAALTALSLSIGDAIPVANATARAALIVTLAGLGITASASSPIMVWRADALPGFQMEVTTDGSTFIPIGPPGAPTNRTRGTVTGGATNSSGVITVTHGLGVTPVNIQHSANGANGSSEMTLRCSARTSTTFSLIYFYNGTNAGASVVSFDWICEA